MFTAFDHQCMALALRLAKQGLNTCDPNPRVGCVLTAEGKIVGTGWHRETGKAHAEVHALAEAGALARAATAYVTLEPCSHHGLTPPCADALVNAGVHRVVVALQDPDSRVSGQGIEQLRQAGIIVETGLLEVEARSLNRGFIQRHEQGRPWVRIKTAISMDGRTALANGESQWISSEESRRDVQRWRARSAAIMCGIGTVLADDPRFSARVNDEVKQPVRIVLDSHWRTPPGARLFDGEAPVVIFGSSGHEIPPGLAQTRAECIPLDVVVGEDASLPLGRIMAVLAEKQINEVQVESGPRLCGSLLSDGLVDEILVYQAPVLLGDDALAPFSIKPLESMAGRTHLKVLERRSMGVDTRILLQPSEE